MLSTAIMVSIEHLYVKFILTLPVLLFYFSTYKEYLSSDSILIFIFQYINPLKPELNPICYLLALLGAHNFLHVSRIRVKLLTLR